MDSGGAGTCHVRRYIPRARYVAAASAVEGRRPNHRLSVLGTDPAPKPGSTVGMLLRKHAFLPCFQDFSLLLLRPTQTNTVTGCFLNFPDLRKRDTLSFVTFSSYTTLHC